MAITRRLLHHDLEQGMRDTEQSKSRFKQPVSKNVRQGRPRTALGDIATNNVSKDAIRQKPKKDAQVGKIINKENAIISKNVYENDAASTKPKAMSICETEDTKSIQNDLDALHMDSDNLALAENDNAMLFDIDNDTRNDPYQCQEYASDIFRYLKVLEKKLLVGDYMNKQSDINERMRAILIDWLIQVHTRFGLLQETLYLTVCIIDRFLECHVVSRSKLQLVGISAMLLASKYEETYAPEIGDFVYISDNSYTKGQIKKMEQLILKTINFDLSNPLCLHFLRRYSKAAQADARQHTLAKYFMELTLVDYEMARRLPSEIAAAALLLSGKILKNSKWTKSLEYYSSFTELELQPIIKSLTDFVIRAESSKLKAVRSKYASSKHMKVSTLIEVRGGAIQILCGDEL